MDWSKFTLLVVDAQQGFWTKRRQKLFPHFQDNMKQLLAFARSNNLSIVHIRSVMEFDQSDWMLRHRLIENTPCIKGTGGVEALPFADAINNEKIILKQTFNGFANGKLNDYLKQHNVYYVLVAGLISSVCVLSTALGASDNGYLVAVIEDCCADNKHSDILSSYPFAFESISYKKLSERLAIWQQEIKMVT